MTGKGGWRRSVWTAKNFCFDDGFTIGLSRCNLLRSVGCYCGSLCGRCAWSCIVTFIAYRWYEYYRQLTILHATWRRWKEWLVPAEYWCGRWCRLLLSLVFEGCNNQSVFSWYYLNDDYFSVSAAPCSSLSLVQLYADNDVDRRRMEPLLCGFFCNSRGWSCGSWNGRIDMETGTGKEDSHSKDKNLPIPRLALIISSPLWLWYYTVIFSNLIIHIIMSHHYWSSIIAVIVTLNDVN